MMLKQVVAMVTLVVVGCRGILTNWDGNRIYNCRYTLIATSLSRDAAAAYCEVAGGKLAVISGDNDNEELLALLRLGKQEQAWIGLYLSPSADPRWDNGAALTYSRLPRNHQNKVISGGSHVIMTSSGDWNVTSEKRQEPFLCGVKRRYITLPDRHSRSESERECGRYGMRLGRIRSHRATCRCHVTEVSNETPGAQSDYGQINSEGKYVPLFRAIQSKRRIVELEHDHDHKVRKGVMKYTFHDISSIHGDAQAYCRNSGGDLACPRTSQEHALILDTIRANAWLGIVDVDEEGTFICIADNSLLKFSNWFHRFGRNAKPEPDNMTDRMKPGASYVQILYDPERHWRHGKWIDRGSPQYEFVVKSAFVCEREVYSQSDTREMSRDYRLANQNKGSVSRDNKH